jgi:catechol 2,3-dioxygenase-like lactoylglutathione lyase family enzyme
MATVSVRYIVSEVDEAIGFYCGLLGYDEVMHPAPAFAMLQRGDLPGAERTRWRAGRGRGGWNRFSIEVDDIDALVAKLRDEGAHFRNDIIDGVGGRQTIVNDPSGNPVELFQPTIDEARLNRSS